ncbi:MAG TPA: DUF5666 domain-containing protein [Candidatus Eisenbacteria bacterium]|nr:DUF5666 domain-containing protein [Candidatus Eisenbacteria bacterium]
MKKISIILLFLCLFGLTVPTVFAAATPTPTPVVSKIEEQINNLKDRIASRVAQLNLVEKRGILGTITDISETQFTITDMSGNNRLVDVDELTKFSTPSSQKSFGISDLSKGTVVGVVGLYNKDSRRLLARFVDVQNMPKVYSGGILSLNKTSFTFTFATVKSDTITVSVEDVTKTLTYTKAGGLVRSGFSKLSVAQRVVVVGFPDIHDKNTILASRVIIFPDIPANPKIPLVKPEDIAPVTSTGSGKKLTPITK